MEYKIEGDVCVLRLEPGEEIIACVEQVCAQEDLRAGYVASAVGALGALLTALITALSASSGVGLHIGAALCCAFLALMGGGILCFLRRYVTVRFTCGCSQCC